MPPGLLVRLALARARGLAAAALGGTEAPAVDEHAAIRRTNARANRWSGGRMPSRRRGRADGFLIDASSRGDGGATGTRTPDPLHAMQVLFQLSYSPTGWG